MDEEEEGQFTFFSPFVLRYTCAVIAKWHQIEFNIQGRTSLFIDKQKIKPNQKLRACITLETNRDKTQYPP